MEREVKRILLLVCFAVAFGVGSIEANEREFLLVLGNYPPYEYEDQNAFKGIHVDILREAFKRLGFQIRLEILPWKRMLKTAETGRSKAVFSLTITEDRLRYLCFPSESLSTVTSALFARKNSGFKIDELNELDNRSIGIIESYTYGEEFDQLSSLHKVNCKDEKEQVLMLSKERVDLVAAEEAPFFFVARKLGLDKDFEKIHTLSEHSLYIGFSKRALGKRCESVVRSFNKVLKEMRAEGIVRKISSRYE